MIRPANHPPTASGPPRHKSGQALLESFGIIMLLCLILFGMVQLTLMLIADEVIQHSAVASTRARAVGLNRFMVEKVSLVTSIPNAGELLNYDVAPESFDNWHYNNNAGSSYESMYEDEENAGDYESKFRVPLTEAGTVVARIPYFLGAQNRGLMYGFLDYSDWDTVSYPIYSTSGDETVSISIRQNYPLRMPFLRAFSDSNEINIRKEALYADHAEYYLE